MISLLENFYIALNAVVPMFILICIGSLIKRLKLMTPEEIKHMNKMVFKIFFGVMMFYNIYNMDFSSTVQPKLMLFCIAGILLTIGISTPIVCHFIKENTTRGAMIHAIYRSNFVFMGIPIAASIFGPENISVTVMMVAIVVPMYNILGVIVLESFRGGKLSPLHMLKDVLKNTMIAGSIIGAVLNLLGINIPSPILKPLGQICAATTPLALMILGASFTWSGVVSRLKPLIATVACRLVVVPGIILASGAMLGFRNVEFVTMISIFAAPCATASFTMAQEMHSDGQLAASAVIFTSLLSCITLFGWIFTTKTLGMF